MLHVTRASVAGPAGPTSAGHPHPGPAGLLRHAELLPLGERPGQIHIHDVATGNT